MDDTAEFVVIFQVRDGCRRGGDVIEVNGPLGSFTLHANGHAGVLVD
jgi:hypothetical protein